MRAKRNLDEFVLLLKGWEKRHGRMPKYRDMAKLFGYRSTQSVSETLDRLTEAGFITRNRSAISFPKPTGIRLLGVVPAGFPSPSEDELSDLIDLNQYLVENQNATFMIKVSGDSMIDAGIMPNDVVFVDKGLTARSGDVVVARVDGENTMKYFFKDKDGVRLEPANKKYSTIRPKDRIEILGVVRSVARKIR